MLALMPAGICAHACMDLCSSGPCQAGVRRFTKIKPLGRKPLQAALEVAYGHVRCRTIVVRNHGIPAKGEKTVRHDCVQAHKHA